MRHYLGCEGDDCIEAVEVVQGEDIILKRESGNLYDKNAVQVYNPKGQLLGYIPRYYSQAFTEFIKENRIEKGIVLGINKDRNCDECIKIEIYVSGQKRK